MFNSCKDENLLTNEDEDEITHTNVTAETRDTEDEECRLVPEFCKETNDLALGIIDNKPKAGILVRIGDENFQVFPIELFNNSKELVVRKGDELFVLSDNKNDYYTSKSSDYQLPSQLSHLFKLDFKEIINQELSIVDIANNTGGTVKGELGSSEFIDLTNNTPPPSTLSITTEHCLIRHVANVRNYVDAFTYGGDITNTLNFLTFAVEEAFQGCSEIYPENICNTCIDPKCVIDNLSENFNISDFEEAVIKANYLRLLLGLSDEEYNWLISTEENRKNVGELYEFTVTCESIEVLKSEKFLPFWQVCNSSFTNYTNTGTGGTIQMECIRNSIYIIDFTYFFGYVEICYEFPDMCIDVGSFNLEDNIPLDELSRRRLTAKAFNKAFNDFNSDVLDRHEDGLPPLSQPQAANIFKNKLSQQLNILISDADVIIGSCDGSIGLGRLIYQLWEGGVCFETSCEC